VSMDIDIENMDKIPLEDVVKALFGLTKDQTVLALMSARTFTHPEATTEDMNKSARTLIEIFFSGEYQDKES